MGRFLRWLAIAFLTFLVLNCIFILWGSASQYPEADYTQLATFDNVVAKDTADSTYKIITYNIGYLSDTANNNPIGREKQVFEANMDLVEQALEAYKPDIIAYQEIDYASARSFKVNQFEELGNRLGFGYGAMAVNWDKRYVPFPYFPISVHFGEMLSGQAIHSRYEILDQERIVLERPPNPFWYDAFYIDRLAQVAKIDLDSQQMVIINVHLEAWDDSVRTRQADKVLGIYKEYAKEYPTILLGDFNSEPPKSKEDKPSVLNILNEAGLASACPSSAYRSEESLTYSARKPTQQIDYIFYNSDMIESVRWQVIKEVGGASDHLPVLMEFKLR